MPRDGSSIGQGLITDCHGGMLRRAPRAAESRSVSRSRSVPGVIEQVAIELPDPGRERSQLSARF